MGGGRRVVVILGVGGYFGYPLIRNWLAKRKEAAKQESNVAPQPVTKLPKPVRPPAAPEKELPPCSPHGRSIWTRRPFPKQGKWDQSPARTLSLKPPMCTAGVLRLFQGASLSPDRELLVYLHLNPGQSPTGHVWAVSQDMRDRSVPQVVKRWKTNPRYAPLSKAYSSGYAMKLQLGEITNGVLPGKIFVALPDTEQSVVAGVFNATTTLADASGVAAPSTTVAPSAAPTPNPAAASDRYRQRYGRKQ